MEVPEAVEHPDAEHQGDSTQEESREGAKRRRKRRGKRSRHRVHSDGSQSLQESELPRASQEEPTPTPQRHEPELEAEPASVQEVTETPVRRGTRGVRRVVAPVGTPEPSTTPEPSGVQGQSQVTIKGQVIALPQSAGVTESTAGQLPPTASLDSLAESLGERGPDQPSVRKPRRSRRASAPVAAPQVD